MQIPPPPLCVEYCSRLFASSVDEQHIDRRFKKLTLHALRKHLAIPMIRLAGHGRIPRDHERPIPIDGLKHPQSFGIGVVAMLFFVFGSFRFLNIAPSRTKDLTV
jgi:hypothetical protein